MVARIFKPTGPVNDLKLYQRFSKLIFADIKFSVKLSDIAKFEYLHSYLLMRSCKRKIFQNEVWGYKPSLLQGGYIIITSLLYYTVWKLPTHKSMIDKYRLPSAKNILKIKNFETQLFLVYATLVPILIPLKADSIDLQKRRSMHSSNIHSWSIHIFLLSVIYKVVGLMSKTLPEIYVKTLRLCILLPLKNFILLSLHNFVIFTYDFCLILMGKLKIIAI